MEKKFNRRMWEEVLERHFMFDDIEINEYKPGTLPCEWYGTFKRFSRLIEGVETTYFFKIMYGKITYTEI